MSALKSGGEYFGMELSGVTFVMIGILSCLVGFGLLFTSSIVANEAGFAQRNCDLVESIQRQEAAAPKKEFDDRWESDDLYKRSASSTGPRRFNDDDDTNIKLSPRLDKSCNSFRTIIFIASLGMFAALMHISFKIAVIFKMWFIWFGIQLGTFNLSIVAFSLATAQHMYEGGGYDIAYLTFSLFSCILCLGTIIGGGFYHFFIKSNSKVLVKQPSKTSK